MPMAKCKSAASGPSRLADPGGQVLPGQRLDAGAWQRRSRWSYRLARLLWLMPGMAFHRFVVVGIAHGNLPLMPRGWHAVSLPGPLEKDQQVQIPGTTNKAARWRWQQGCSSIGVGQGDALVGSLWTTTAAFREDEADILFEPGEGVLWDLGMYLPASQRVGRGFAALCAALAAAMERAGAGWSCSRITDYNHASLAAHARLGARDLGTVTCLRLGPVQLTRINVEPDRPSWHLNVRGGAVPRVNLTRALCQPERTENAAD